MQGNPTTPSAPSDPAGQVMQVVQVGQAESGTRSALPSILIIGTGGTIAGAGASSTAIGSYQSAVFGVNHLLAAVPSLQTLAQLSAEQLFQIDSADFTDSHTLQLARHVAAALARDDVDGVVITHGTDSLEESAYFLHLTLKSSKPVVVTGAMRPGTALSADGPLNLYNAVAVAAHGPSAGQGVLVVMNDEIHSARDVAKTSSQKVETFASPYGPLGLVLDGQPRWYRAVLRPHTLQSEFELGAIQTLPWVAVVASHAGMGPVAYEAFQSAGAQAIVHAGFGGGTVPQHLKPLLQDASRVGVFVVRAARCGSGALVRTAEDQANGWLVVDDQSAQKARILMALGLTRTREVSQLQALFGRY